MRRLSRALFAAVYNAAGRATITTGGQVAYAHATCIADGVPRGAVSKRQTRLQIRQSSVHLREDATDRLINAIEEGGEQRADDCASVDLHSKLIRAPPYPFGHQPRDHLNQVGELVEHTHAQLWNRENQPRALPLLLHKSGGQPLKHLMQRGAERLGGTEVLWLGVE